MSLAIHPGFVSKVLLADGWHDVDYNSELKDAVSGPYAFDLDSYEYLIEYYSGNVLKHRSIFVGGQSDLVSATGFEFVSNGVKYCGPITSIIAVQHSTPNEPREA